MPVWIRWMLVDSSGSRNPDDSPIATTFFSQALSRRPGAKRTGRGSASGCAVEIGEQRFRRFVVADQVGRIDIAIADAVLQRDAPLPTRRARGATACRA